MLVSKEKRKRQLKAITSKGWVVSLYFFCLLYYKPRISTVIKIVCLTVRLERGMAVSKVELRTII